MLPAAFLPLHKLYHNGEKQEEIPCIINFLHVPVDEIIGCPLGLVEQSYLELVGQRDSTMCGQLQNMGNSCLEEGFLREKKTQAPTDFPVGL